MQIGIRELKAKLSEYVRRAHEGESLEVTDHGVPVARLTPLPAYYPTPDESGLTLREPTAPAYEVASRKKSMRPKAAAQPKRSYAELLKEAQKAWHHKTPKDTLIHALREYLDYKRRLDFIDLFGTVDFDPTYDYKAGRKNRS